MVKDDENKTTKVRNKVYNKFYQLSLLKNHTTTSY